jgi:hypothetical protein
MMSVLSMVGYGIMGGGLHAIFTAKDSPELLRGLIFLASGAGLVVAG